MKRADLKNSADLFLYKAEMDLHAAKIIYSAGEKGDVDIEPEIILFHLQQAVEKALKALLSDRKIRINHTHDLQKLSDLCKDSGINPPPSIEALTVLTAFAVEGRYSLIHDDMALCDKLVPVAEEFVASVRDTIKSD